MNMNLHCWDSVRSVCIRFDFHH